MRVSKTHSIKLKSTIILLATCLILYIIYKIIWQLPSFESNYSNKVTIRVNTYRRLDLLKIFLDYHEKCDAIEEIQVVWSDLEYSPPENWTQNYENGKVVFEIHSNNSLTNRFISKLKIKTEAVLSIDDDLVIPCDDIKNSLNVWQSNRYSIVGFTPRMATHDIISGKSRYLRWQHTWWNGIYSIMLTKVAFLHRDYLQNYKLSVPNVINEYIDKHKNCEDISMAHLVATQAKVAPVWVRGVVYETSSYGISSNKDHFSDRSHCLDFLKSHFHNWPWITGYQKLLRMNYFDSIYLWDD